MIKFINTNVKYFDLIYKMKKSKIIEIKGFIKGFGPA